MTEQKLTHYPEKGSSKNQSPEELLILLSSAMEAMKNVLPHNIEVVLHDLTHPEASVVKIINGKVTCRKEGEPLLSAPDDNDGFVGMIVKGRNLLNPFTLSGYNCRLKSGKRVKSGSATYYNDNGEPIIAFAINVAS